MNSPSPRTSLDLFGHEAAEALLLNGLQSGRLAHGWIIGGPEGIGKATLAYRFARALLAGQSTFAMDADHPVFRRVAAGSHTDLLVVQPAYDAKKEEYARDITIEQARDIGSFLALTPGESRWRVVIIDSADALNVNSANAILKLLEEPPPQALLMLISHNPARLLPTIRSRCRSLLLSHPSAQDFNRILRTHTPELSVSDLHGLYILSAQAPGLAIQLLQQDALSHYDALLDLLSPLPQLDMRKLHAFSEQWASGSVHSNWQLLQRLLLTLFERTAKTGAGVQSPPISDKETFVINTLLGIHPPAIWAEKWQQCLEQFSLVSRLHLDYKQVIIAFMHSIHQTEGFSLGNTAA